MSHHLFQLRYSDPGNDIDFKWGCTGNNSVQESVHVDRSVRSLSNTERPQEKCDADVQRVVCEVQTGTHTSAKAVCDELDVVLNAAF